MHINIKQEWKNFINIILVKAYQRQNRCFLVVKFEDNECYF